jgi:hypothetical protein
MKLFGVKSVVAGFFPGRSARWVKERIKAGDFGPAWLDGGGYLVSEAGIAGYLKGHELNLDRPIPRGRRENLVNA